MCRHVEQLKFARYAKPPGFLGKRKRVRGKKAAGLRYEKKLGEELARRGIDFGKGLWIEFEDANGKGFAQPDFVVYGSGKKWRILEAKLSQTNVAFEQLFSLYLPLLAHLHPDIEFTPLQVCRNLRGIRAGDPRLVDDLEKAQSGCIWHWLD